MPLGFKSGSLVFVLAGSPTVSRLVIVKVTLPSESVTPAMSAPFLSFTFAIGVQPAANFALLELYALLA